METGLLHIHSYLRYLALLLLTINIFWGFMAFINIQSTIKSFRKFSLVTMTLMHIQLITGLLLYFLKGYPKQVGNLSNLLAEQRFFALEHALAMVIAIAVITVGYVLGKRDETPRGQFGKITLFYFIGFMIIFFMIPWPFLKDWATYFPAP